MSGEAARRRELVVLRSAGVLVRRGLGRGIRYRPALHDTAREGPGIAAYFT